MTTKPIIVIGAGIVGVSTAIWLQRAGKKVVLLDKGAAGMGASYGNAGLLAGWGIAPITSPGLWRDIPKYMTHRDSPVFLKWAQLPSMLPFLAKFLSNATDRKTRRIVSVLDGLIGDTVDQHKSLTRGTPVESWVHDSKIVFAYNAKSGFDGDAYSWGLKAAAGLVPTVLTGRDVQEAEPMLGNATGCLAILEGFGHVTDPGGYVAALAAHFVAMGGQFVQAEVQDFTKQNGRIVQVETSEGPFECEAAVVTSGIWSKDLMVKLGLRVPMVAERGYHVVFQTPSQTPKHPMLMMDAKFGVNAMDMGLRCAGVSELGDHHAGASAAPIKLLRRMAAKVFPDLTYTGTDEWMGFRPSTPDSLPLVGDVGDSGVFVGFGHQHLGLTAGPKTGRMLSQIITGQRPNADIAPFYPLRFS